MGIVYEAEDQSNDRRVALKLLGERRFSEKGLRHFEQEFLTLTSLNHPHLTEVYEFGRLALDEAGREIPFFTMELVRGEDLGRYLANFPADWTRLYGLLAQAAQALAYLHGRGIVHQDVKTSNILVDSAGASPVVKLMDLGLAGRPRDAGEAGLIRGTAAYLAPEIARGGPVDGRADLYGLGCVIYEVVTRRTPFQAASPVGVVRAHLEERPIAPSLIERSVPPALEVLILRLLEKDPGRRFPSADRFLEALNEVAGGNLPPVTPETRRRRVLGAGFFGREEQLRRLAAALDDARRGAGRLVLLVGEAGVGKSHLLREFQIRCQLDGVDAYVGRPGEAPGDAGAFGGALKSAIRGRGPLSPETRARHGAALAPLLGEAKAEAGGEADEIGGFFAAAGAALEEIARRAPLVLAAEDLHLAGEAECALLRHAVRGLAPARGVSTPPLPLLIVGTYRAEELSRHSPLFDLIAEGREEGLVEEVLLDPLSQDDAASLLRSMLGAAEVPEAFLQRVLGQTRGNPAYLAELIAVLAEEGHVDPGSGRLPEAETLARVEIPGKIRDLLARRLSRLDEEPIRVLVAGAVLGGAVLDPDALAVVTGLRWEHVVRRLGELVSDGFVSRDADEEGAPVYRMAHPGLADLVIDNVAAEERQGLHARALAYLERRGLPRLASAWADLARHAEAAGRPGRAAEAFGRAGEISMALNAHRDAIGMFDRAVELLLRQEAAPAGPLCDLFERRAAARAALGQDAEAEEDLRWMLARAEKEGTALIQARAHLALGELRRIRERPAEAEPSLDLALEIAERVADPELSSRAGTALAATVARLGRAEEGIGLVERAIAGARAAGLRELEAEALLVKGRIHRDAGNFRASIQCFDDAAGVAGARSSAALSARIEESAAEALELQGRYADAVEAYSSARARALERGDAPAVASLTMNLGTLRRRTGAHEEAQRDLEEALALHRRGGGRDGAARCLEELALLHADGGRFDAALAHADETLKLSRRIGDRDLVAAGLHLVGQIELRLGRLAEAAANLEEAHRLLRESRSPRRLPGCLMDLGDVQRLSGRADEARRLFQEAAFLSRKIGERRLEADAMLRLGDAHLVDNDYDRASVSCRKAAALAEGSGLARLEAAVALLRARVELVRPGGDVVRAEIEALDALRRSEETRDSEGIWQAAHVAGRAALRLGRRDEAVARIERAWRHLEAQRSLLSASWREAFARHPTRAEVYEDRARMRSGPARDETPAGLDPAGGEFARLREEAARTHRLLDAIRAIARAKDEEALSASAMEAALDLGGADAAILVVDDRETATARGGKPMSTGLSQALRTAAAAASTSHQPLSVPDAISDPRFPSLLGAPAGESLWIVAAPVIADGGETGALAVAGARRRGGPDASIVETIGRLGEHVALALGARRRLRGLEARCSELEAVHRELQRTVQAQRHEIQDVREELFSTRSSIELRYRFEDLVGASPGMLRVYYLIERLAPKRLPVLVVGESGTGKELIARALHAKGDRSAGPFFTVNCAALHESLLESEIFGHRKGAFTGADRDKPGYFELADGGTLFLDEIGDMGLAVQAKLLRAIQGGEILPVGGKSTVRVDVRIVSATHRDLSAMIREGQFREDLYYRINVARIEVPPLRNRREDIPLLVDHFLGALAEEEGQPRKTIDAAALRRLAAHTWPGNVRELQHQLLRAATFAKAGTITLKDVERYCDLPRPATPAAEVSAANGVGSLEAMERKQILLALEKAGGNKTRAAEILGINRVTLFRKLRRFEIE